MKYCNNCGMLLEDTHTTCIRCGADVSSDDNASLYPPEVMESLESQKAEKKDKMKIIILIIAIFVIIAGVVAVVAIGISNGTFAMPGITASTENSGESDDEDEEDISEEDAESDEDIDEDETLEEEDFDEEDSEGSVLAADEQEEASDEAGQTEVITGPRTVKDAKGHYYNYKGLADKNGEIVLNAVYPEDFTETDFSIDYAKYSNEFPINMTFWASNKENSVRFLYMSPQHYWYKVADNGKAMNNVMDPATYMSYYQYDGPKGYIENMLNQSYPKSKIVLIEENSVSAPSKTQVETLSKNKTADIKNAIKNKDYGHIGKGTEYELLESECSANVYEYEITTDDNQLVFDKFFVPIISNKLKYNCSQNNDKGTLTEWCMLGFAVLEAGNEDLYYEFIDDFDVFIANCVPTQSFMALCQIYSGEINESVNASRRVERMTDDLLETLSEDAKSEKLNTFYTDVTNVLATAGGTAFENSGNRIFAGEKAAVAFIDKVDEKVFISNAADEYPGDSFTEYVQAKSSVITSSATPASTSDKSDDASKSSDDKEKKVLVEEDEEDEDDEDDEDEEDDEEEEDEDEEDEDEEE